MHVCCGVWLLLLLLLLLLHLPQAIQPALYPQAGNIYLRHQA